MFDTSGCWLESSSHMTRPFSIAEDNMAVFEQKKCSKVTLDDTTTLTCSIENAQNVKDHIVSTRVLRNVGEIVWYRFSFDTNTGQVVVDAQSDICWPSQKWKWQIITTFSLRWPVPDEQAISTYIFCNVILILVCPLLKAYAILSKLQSQSF